MKLNDMTSNKSIVALPSNNNSERLQGESVMKDELKLIFYCAWTGMLFSIMIFVGEIATK